MERNRTERYKKRLDLHLSMTVRDIFEAIDQEHSRPVEMAYFDRFFREFGTEEKRIVNTEGRKIIGFYCMNVPEILSLFPRLATGKSNWARFLNSGCRS